jgi:hypothetical protein
MLTRLKIKAAATNEKILNFFKKFSWTNTPYKNLFYSLVFLCLLNGLYSYVGVYERLNERPCSIHASAQCQRASIALNYYNVDMNFFKPRIQRFTEGDGITGVEFPIVYYAGALLYKLFGFNEAYIKIINLVILSLGLLFFFLLTQRFIKNIVLSLIVIGSATLSPVLLYYGANFMPDIPGLAFVLCAWYFFFEYLSKHQTTHLNLMIFFGALAALIKVIAIIFLVIILCLVLLDKFKFFKKESLTHLFKDSKKVLLRVCIGIVVVLVWYGYAKWLSAIHHQDAFAMGPRMVFDKEGIQGVYDSVKNYWFFQYYSYETYVFIIVALVLSLLMLKRLNKLLLTITILYIMASLCYIVLFLYQFKHHDYYIIAILPCIFFLLLVFVDALNRLSINYSFFVTTAFAFIMFFNWKECLLKCKENYFFRFDSNVYLAGDYKPYYDLEPKLRALGIKREDKFVSAFDNSYSNSLYFMNQAGVTVEDGYGRDTIANSLQAKDVRYLVVNDSAKFNKAYPNDFSKKIILIHRGLIIYKLK